MSRYLIPDIFKPGFILISKLNQKQVKQIAKKLSSIDFGLNDSKIAESLTDSIQLEKNDLTNIIKSALSLLSFKQKDNINTSRDIQDLIDSIEEQIKDIDIKNLKKNLKLFEKIDGPTIQTMKGHQILRENEKNYISSRIISDLRIVFDDELKDEGIKNAVIVHNLRLDYFASNDKISVFLALDHNDLEELKNTIERAIQKENLIRKDSSFNDLKFLTNDKD